MKYLFHSALLVFVLTAPGICRNKPTDLKDKRVTVRAQDLPFGMILGYLMFTYEIPIGFEQSTLDRNSGEHRFSSNPPGVAPYKLERVDGVLKIASHPGFKAASHPVTVDAENERLEDVLNRVVKQMENYRWEINDGVVNIYPVKGRDKRFEKLLGLRIKRFVFEKGGPVAKITTSIKSLPEFSAFTEEHNLRFSGTRSGPEGALREQYGRTIEAGMDLSNMTFRDLLNRITRIKGGGWTLKWRFLSTKTGEEYIDIDI